jgi:ribosome-associated protein
MPAFPPEGPRCSRPLGHRLGFSFPRSNIPPQRQRSGKPQRNTIIARKPPPGPPPTDVNAAPTRRKAPVRKRPKPALALADKVPETARKKAVVAGPRKTAKRSIEPSRLDHIQAVIVGSLEDDKAEDVVTLDLAGKASFCDRMIIATGLADRQISAMATHLEQKLHEAGLKRVQTEGAGTSDWVLIDAGDIVVHLFKPDARTLYALEKMWGADLDETAQEA